MDPTTCYRDLRDALRDRDYALAHELAESLRQWLDKGGFMPSGASPWHVHRSIARAMNTTNVEYEKTDTFGGDANYSWCRRHAEPIPADAKDREIVRRAKAWAGWTGHPCKVSHLGDTIEIRPRGVCQVLFISFPC